MEARYEARKRALLDECRVGPELVEGVLPRLEEFMEPFVDRLLRPEQVAPARPYVHGLLSDVERKNAESMAYRFGQDRMPLQGLVGVLKTDYYLSNAHPDTSEAEFARAAKAEHRIEEGLQRAKNEAGLADYEVRHWKGWHHHQILSLIATWFLVTEARRGKEWTPAITVPQIREGLRLFLHPLCGCACYPRPYPPRTPATTPA